MTTDADRNALFAEVREWLERRLSIVEAISQVDHDAAHELAVSVGRGVSERFGEELRQAGIPVSTMSDQALSQFGFTWMRWPAKYVLIEREQLTAYGITGQVLAQMAPGAKCPKCGQSGPHGNGEIRCPECGRPLPPGQ